jgi:predicted Rossmann fold nucleotide-binding protein DprA/Smf involved in DNA uptake
MGRNKYVYALADYELVVSADLGKGGTWAGAIEALQRYQSTSVFVRNVENLPGNQVFLQKGANSFPDPPWSAMRNLLAEMVDPSAEMKPLISANGSNSHHLSKTSSSTPTTEIPKSTQVIGDPPEIYNQVLRILCHYLQKPTDKKTLAKQLNAQSENVTESQLSKWLERAIAEGILKTEKVKRQTVYVLANKESQVLIDPFECQLSLLK